MKKIEFNELIMNFILFSFINNIFVQSTIICSKSTYCKDCEIIYNDIDNYKNKCEYRYLYCLNNNRQIVFFNNSLKSNYVNHFYKIPDIKNICGEQNIYLNNSNFEKTIEFGKKDSYYLNENSICCNYEVINNLIDYNIFLSISKIRKKYEEVLSFDIYIHLPNSTVLNVNEEELLNLNNISSFSIMLDVYGGHVDDLDFWYYKKNYNNIEDLKIKIYSYKNNNDKKQYGLPNKNPEENPKNKKSDSNVTEIIFYVLISIGLFFIFILLIYFCIATLRNRRRNNLNRQNIRNNNLNRDQSWNNLNRNERNAININQENVKKQKLEFIFYNTLYPMKYSIEIFIDNVTNCSICLENYIDQKSLICLTPCNHIFHYDCLKKWSLNNTRFFRCPNCNYDFTKENASINRNNFHNNININDNNINANLNTSEIRASQAN